MNKVLDTVKPAPKTEFGRWELWMNAWYTRMLANSHNSRPIEVKEDHNV